MKTDTWKEEDITQLGARIGSCVTGGELIELVGDVGAGKTTLTRSIARGMGIEGPIQSPTFTISNRYEIPNGLCLAHYDFYRLDEAGIMAEEINEVLEDETAVTVIEWAGIVDTALPVDRLIINFETIDELTRKLTITGGGLVSEKLKADIE
tara:strand:- start:150 stop:605 length:456 start_codon:yes stop_codon:yes gene_type:complete